MGQFIEAIITFGRRYTILKPKVSFKSGFKKFYKIYFYKKSYMPLNIINPNFQWNSLLF
jgi:hypothetical protein